MGWLVMWEGGVGGGGNGRGWEGREWEVWCGVGEEVEMEIWGGFIGEREERGLVCFWDLGIWGFGYVGM